MKFDLIGGWTVADYGDEAIRQTSGALRILIENRPASMVVDTRSNTTREEIRVALYPLALWIASSWWRLRWEPTTSTPQPARETSWRMCHEMAASGHGYTWPTILFASDGETVEVTCRASDSAAVQPVRFLSNITETVPGRQFDQALDDLVDLVISRLDNVGIRDSQLHRLWSDVLAERGDLTATQYRRIEAQLGFDPDEGSQTVVDTFVNASERIGDKAISELAPVCSGADPTRMLTNISDSVGYDGVPARAISLDAPPVTQSLAPWERGYVLADHARQHFNLNPGPVPDNVLADLLEIDPSVLGAEPLAGARRPPVSIATRDDDSQKLKLFLQKQLHASRRFEVARMLAESINAPEEDRWLPVTDFKTARQKLQRAFAAELLCPIGKLREFMNGDYSDERVNEAGMYFQVSPLIVEHQRDNRLMSGWVF